MTAPEIPDITIARKKSGKVVVSATRKAETEAEQIRRASLLSRKAKEKKAARIAEILAQVYAPTEVDLSLTKLMIELEMMCYDIAAIAESSAWHPSRRRRRAIDKYNMILAGLKAREVLDKAIDRLCQMREELAAHPLSFRNASTISRGFVASEMREMLYGRSRADGYSQDEEDDPSSGDN